MPNKWYVTTLLMMAQVGNNVGTSQLFDEEIQLLKAIEFDSVNQKAA